MRRHALIIGLGMLALSACSEEDSVGPGSADVPPAFAPVADCESCHPDQTAQWARSRHAYSGVDPVAARMGEVAGEEVASACQKCHAPAQRRLERLTAAGLAPGTMDLSEDGLGCDVCHSISEIPPVASVEFLDQVDPSGPKYANMSDPIDTPAHASERRDWYGTSSACAPCHQFDLANGTRLENTFIEWQDTNLSGMGLECQGCHMRTYTGRAAVSGPIREDLHRHDMVGPDYAYEPFRGIDLDQQKRDIDELLRNSVTVNVVDMPSAVTAGSPFTFGVEVYNDKTGHSIPSGVSFAREMWIEVEVTDASGATVYRSGWLKSAAEDSLLVGPEEDPDLATFWAKMYDVNDEVTPFAWEADRIDESGLLQYLERRIAWYTVESGTTGWLDVQLTLRFRSLSPALVRQLDLERILPIEVFDMWGPETHRVLVN